MNSSCVCTEADDAEACSVGVVLQFKSRAMADEGTKALEELKARQVGYKASLFFKKKKRNWL